MKEDILKSSWTDHQTCTLTVIAPYTIIALMVSIRREMANPTQAFSVWEKTRRSCDEQGKKANNWFVFGLPFSSARFIQRLPLGSVTPLSCVLLVKHCELMKRSVYHIHFPLYRSDSCCPWAVLPVALLRWSLQRSSSCKIPVKKHLLFI